MSLLADAVIDVGGVAQESTGAATVPSPSTPPAAHQPGNPGETPAQAIAHAPLGGTNSIDGSGYLFQTYLDMAMKEDSSLAKQWEGGADGIIIFTGLFSAAVATLLAVSTQGLQQNSADISAFYLAKIYQLQADANGSQVTIPSTLSPPSSNFSPPYHVVLVNSLWFLSLSISITCALSATLVQQWARRYIKVTQQPYTPHKQARIRAFFAEGIHKFYLPWVVELLPTFLHLSVFLFFAGLGVFLFHLNQNVFFVVIWWLGLCAVAYICIVFMPIIGHDSPYYSPLSSLVWYLWIGIRRIYFMILGWFKRSEYFSYASWERNQQLQERYRKWFQHGIQRAAEDSAQELQSEIDGRALVWTLESFVRDQDPHNKQEDFVRGIPAFCKSKVVRNPRGGFKVPHAEKISEALVGLLHHTLSSKSANQHRIDICINAIRDAPLPITLPILQRVIYKDWDKLLGSADFVKLLETTTYNDRRADYYSKCAIAAHIRATAQKRDDRWFELAESQLGKSRAILEGYGDCVLLANCINICRCTINAYSTNNDWTVGAGWRSKCFQMVSNFDLSITLPGLQYEFCCLWNNLIHIANNPLDRRMQTLAMLILRHIRKIYIELHQGTDAAPTAFGATTDDYNNVLFYPKSYPSCSIQEHGTHTHEATAGSIGVTVHARDPTVTPPTAPTQAASASTPQQVFAPSSSGTTAIPEAPGTPSPFPPATVPSHTPSAEPDLSSPTPPSQIPLATAIPPAPPQVEVPHDDPYQTAPPGPEIPTDISPSTAPP